jgi:hypothetical protein
MQVKPCCFNMVLLTKHQSFVYNLISSVSFILLDKPSTAFDKTSYPNGGSVS